jgi:hypothetical protein
MNEETIMNYRTCAGAVLSLLMLAACDGGQGTPPQGPEARLVRTAVTASSKEGWFGSQNPEGAVVAAHITVTRVAGPGPAECT